MVFVILQWFGSNISYASSLTSDDFIFSNESISADGFGGDIIVSGDLSTFKELVFLKEDVVERWDYRNFHPLDVSEGKFEVKRDSFRVFVFKATYTRGNDFLIRVSTEISPKSRAGYNALKYAKIVGQVPNFLRTENSSMTIFEGNGPWAASREGIIIHTDMYSGFDKHLEEMILHEAAHISLDPWHGGSIENDKWIKIIRKDKKFISSYAMVQREKAGSVVYSEDKAETILWWVAVRCKPDRLTNYIYDSVTEGISNRLAYFDEQNFDTYPLKCFSPNRHKDYFNDLKMRERKEVQKRLKLFGYDAKIDGIWGRGTERALLFFIIKNGENIAINSENIFERILK